MNSVEPSSEKPVRRTAGPMASMAISLAVLVVPILLLVAFCQPNERTPLGTVDASRTYAAAREQARFTVREPQGLPTSWRATRARLQPSEGGAITVRVIYRTPNGRFLQYAQTDIAATNFLAEELEDAKFEQTESIGGRDWQRYRTDRRGDTVLVASEGPVTQVVAGDADASERARFVESLR